MKAAVRNRLLKSLVKVEGRPKSPGTGFLVGGEYVFTAARCLPSSAASTRGKRVPVTIRSPHAGIQVRALVEYVEPCSDFAILSNGDQSDNDFFRLADKVDSVRVACALPRLDKELDVYTCTSKKQWVRGTTTINHPFAQRLIVEFEGPIPDASVGAPIFDDRGLVIGIVSPTAGPATGPAHAVSAILLPNALPMWLVKMLETE